MAETVTLAVAHAFSTAYEAWRILPTTKEFTTKENQQNNINTRRDIVEEKLIDFGDDDQSEFGNPHNTSHWVRPDTPKSRS